MTLSNRGVSSVIFNPAKKRLKQLTIISCGRSLNCGVMLNIVIYKDVFPFNFPIAANLCGFISNELGLRS